MSEFSSATQMVAAPALVRVFLSSPGDVVDERNLARSFIKEQLPYLPQFRGRVAFDVVSWDDPVAVVPMLANKTPQESVTLALTRPATCEITIVILWSRMGTPLPDSIRKPNGAAFVSGTEWEYLDACESPLKPVVLVYRRTEEPKVGLKDPKQDEKKEQYKRGRVF